MPMNTASEQRAWSVIARTRESSLSLSTPGPLPSAVGATCIPTGCVANTRERLTHLHNIIQRSLDHAEIPSRKPKEERLLSSSSALSQESLSSTAEGDVTYMSCMEQLVLAQFEGLGRKDIMLRQSESYGEMCEEWYRTMAGLLHPSVIPATAAPSISGHLEATASSLDHADSPSEGKPFCSTTTSTTTTTATATATTTAAAAAVPAVDGTLLGYSLLGLMWQETSAREALILQETAQFSALHLDASAIQRLSLISKGGERLVELLEGTVAVLNQSANLAQLLTRWETEEEKEVDGGTPPKTQRENISEQQQQQQPLRLLPSTPLCSETECHKNADPREDCLHCSHTSARMEETSLCSPADLLIRSGSEPRGGRSASRPSCTPRQLTNTPTGNHTFLSGYLYRSSVPHVMWQLRFHKLEDGVLRFSKVTPDGKHTRWWTVLAASEIMHVELEDYEGGIGEARPPLWRSDGCCFSIYFKRNTECTPRRLRLCCTRQSETMNWFFALRHAMQKDASAIVALK